MTPGTILTNIMDGYGTETKAINTVIAHLKEVENASLSLLFIEQTQVSMFWSVHSHSPVHGRLALSPTRWGNQLNGNLCCMLCLVFSLWRAPLAGAISWMETINLMPPFVDRSKPHSLGQSVEWKLYPLLNLLYYKINSPTRWGNQLNGNSVQGSVESFTNTAPLAGAISWMESPKVTVKHLAPRWGAANFLRKQLKEHTITAEVKMWEGDEFKCKHCGVTPPKGHWRPITWLEKHEANCPNNPELKEQWLVSRIFTRVTKRKHQRQAPLAGAISWMETCHRVYT